MKKRFSLLLTACAAVTLGMGAVAFSACGETSVKEHEHQWESSYITETRATCSKEGSKIRHCTVPKCTAVDRVPIPKLDHTFLPEGENTATCTEDGHMIWTCKYCGEKVDGEETKAYGHSLIADKVVSEATCLAKGSMQFKCTNPGCTYTETQDTAKLPHDYQLSLELSKPATCKEEGESVTVCVNGCNDKKTEKLDKLDHQISADDIVEPTFSAPGRRNGICALCHEQINEEIPQLVDGAKVDFTFRILKGEQAFSVTTMKLTVKDQTGKEVATGTGYDIVGGKFTVKLEIHPGTTYTLTVTNLMGYRADPVTVNPASPNGIVNILAELYKENDPNAPAQFKVGDMAQDFTMDDIDGNTITLSKVLKKNKVVMLSFFYSSCYACNSEASGLQQAYSKYKDKGLEIIAISTNYYESNSDLGLQNFRSTYGITFPMIREALGGDKTAYTYEKYLYSTGYAAAGFPTSIFIDHDGLIKLTPQAAGYPQAQFEQWFEFYTNTYWPDLDGGAETVTAEVPQDESNGLLISVLRGDYLPGEERE